MRVKAEQRESPSAARLMQGCMQTPQEQIVALSATC